MADFFRKIRKNGATFMRDRVAPRVREQLSAAQQRAANAPKRDVQGKSQKGASGPHSSEKSGNQSRERMTTRQASWPERPSAPSRAPQEEGAPSPAQAPQKPAKPNGALRKPAQSKATPKNSAQVKPQPAQTNKTETQETKNNKTSQAPKNNDRQGGESQAKPKNKASENGKGKTPAVKRPVKQEIEPPRQSSASQPSSDKPRAGRKKTSSSRPAATHMKRIREEREERLKTSRSTGHYGKSKSALPAQKGSACISKTGAKPRPSKAPTKIGGTAKAPSFTKGPGSTKVANSNRSVSARKAAAKRAKSAESRKQKSQQRPNSQAQSTKPKPPVHQEQSAKQSAKSASKQTPKAIPQPKAGLARPAEKPTSANAVSSPAAPKSAGSAQSAPTSSTSKAVKQKSASPAKPKKAVAASTPRKQVAPTQAQRKPTAPTPAPRKQVAPTQAQRKPAVQPQVAASEKKPEQKRPTAAQFRNRTSATFGKTLVKKDQKPAQPAAKRRHIPGLDGVRGIAVVAVLLYHFWPHLFPGGFMGVDMFFVLSGYLITFLLVREYRKTGRISLKQFWLRRARRILPAALVVIAICTALVSLFRGDIAVKVGYHAWTSALFVSNWGQIAESGSYFSDNGLNIFTHYWSLSIEEQFYLVWPLLVMGILALGLRSRTINRLVKHPATNRAKGSADSKANQLSLLLYATIAIGAVSFIAMLVLYDPDEDPTRVYFGTDTHAFGLAVGAAIAFVVSRGSALTTPRHSPATKAAGPLSRLNPALEAAAWIGFAALFAMLLTVHDTSSFTYRGGLLIASLLTGWLVMLSVRGEGLLVRVLSHPSLAWFGDRSFSLYLWHWPLLLMSRQFFTQTLDMHGDFATHVLVPFTALATTMVGTYVTYHYVENPFRKQGYRKTLLSLKGPRLAATTATTSLVAVGIVVALVTAPSQTNVEKQLEALAAQQQKAKSSQSATATGAAADPNASPMKTHQLPRGRAMTAIGDSVMLASYDALKKRYPGIFIDAGVSRHYSGGQPILQNLKAQKNLRNTVILGFGTNGQAFPGQLNEIMDVIGPDRTVILVAPYGPVNGIPEAAQQVLDFAAKRPNVFPAMWCQVAAKNRNALYSDGVHPKPESADLYVRAITDALKQAASGEKQPRQTCPPM